MEDEAVKFPVVLNSMKEGGFTFYFFIYFLYVNACGMHMCVCVWCGYGAKRRLVGVLLYHS